MHTNEKLARALEAAGLADMAAKARTGYYPDFQSPLDFPDLQLVEDLHRAGTEAALDLRCRAVAGEFDATPAEGDAWAASAEGQAAFRALSKGR